MAKSAFKAPTMGLYEFQLKMHNGDREGKNQTCAAIAQADDGKEFSKVAEACLAINATGTVATHLWLRAGDMVVPVFTGKATNTVGGSPYDDINELNELTQFYGMLVETV
jgi:hypothetical protein